MTIKANLMIDYIEIFKKQSKNKERIDNIREDLKDLSYKLSKSKLKEIKKLVLKKLINI